MSFVLTDPLIVQELKEKYKIFCNPLINDKILLWLLSNSQRNHIEQFTSYKLVEGQQSTIPIPFDMNPSSVSTFLIRNEVFSFLNFVCGFYLTNGVKFGCHYLAYTNDPSSSHSEYCVWIVKEEQDIDKFDIISMVRLSNSVGKKAMIVTMATSDGESFIIFILDRPSSIQDDG